MKANSCYQKNGTVITVSQENKKSNQNMSSISLLEKFAVESNDTTTASYADTLESLGAMVAYSVLKTAIDPMGRKGNDETGSGQNEKLVRTRTELSRDRAKLESLKHCNEYAYDMNYNEDGYLVSVVSDSNCKESLDQLSKETLGDGLDVMHTAIIAILAETEKQRKRGETVDLERPYTVRRLKRKVYIKESDSVNGWETVETTPIQEIFREVRRYIISQQSERIESNGYSYIECVSHDKDSDETAVVYKRLAKYADLGGYAHDANGANTFYTVESETVRDTETLISSLNLTARQAQVLTLRQRGYGYKAIATHLGIRPDSVRDAFKAIQSKAIAIGLTPDGKEV